MIRRLWLCLLLIALALGLVGTVEAAQDAHGWPCGTVWMIYFPDLICASTPG